MTTAAFWLQLESAEAGCLGPGGQAPLVWPVVTPTVLIATPRGTSRGYARIL